MTWWIWLLLAWMAGALVLAPVIGLTIRSADRLEWVGSGAAAEPGRSGAPVRRRRLLWPPASLALIAVGIGLEAVGLRRRLTGTGADVGPWSMDLPLSVPRMYIAGLLALAAVIAFIGAGRAAGRRPWWSAVGVVAAAAAAAKAGGTVYLRILDASGLAERPVLAVVCGSVVLGGVLTALWWSSRTERRDRRRVLTAFALYGVAAVGFAGVSVLVEQAVGLASPWAAVATFIEESAEAVGAVAVLVAVLVGVAPRLVLPAGWRLRRQADAEQPDAQPVGG